AKAHIDAGICGMHTDVEATAQDNYMVELNITSTCPSIQKLANEIPEVDAMGHLSFRRGMPEIIAKAPEYCAHPACPVPAGIIKAVEVAAGMALPKNATITIEG
ncbi:MAG: hypothetical protein GWN61_06355, partial [candidate division Zixibacteria bacterium]|nr:hypothetical protein [candidate division Zixibacteria bacterium]NIV05809.1 hypothetical protein [candidate division Zixibacteria bacterium]